MHDDGDADDDDDDDDGNDGDNDDGIVRMNSKSLNEPQFSDVWIEDSIGEPNTAR